MTQSAARHLLGLAAAAFCVSCATPRQGAEAPGRYSLATAEWDGMTNVESSPCPAGDICLNVVADGRFEAVRTLSGPRAPNVVTARMDLHSEPRRDIVLLVLLRHPGAGERWGAQVIDGGPPEDEACVGLETLERYGVPRPANGRRRGGDRICFRL